MPLFSRLRPVPLKLPTLDELALLDSNPLMKKKTCADVVRVTSEALDRAGTLTLTPELAEFADAFTERLSSLTTEPGGDLAPYRGSALHQVTEAVKVGAAFADSAAPAGERVTAVDPVTACAKGFAVYRHTHFEPKDLGIMGYFSAQCGFYLPLAGAKTQDVLPSLPLVMKAAFEAAAAYTAATATMDAIWERWAGE